MNFDAQICLLQSCVFHPALLTQLKFKIFLLPLCNCLETISMFNCLCELQFPKLKLHGSGCRPAPVNLFLLLRTNSPQLLLRFGGPEKRFLTEEFLVVIQITPNRINPVPQASLLALLTLKVIRGHRFQFRYTRLNKSSQTVDNFDISPSVYSNFSHGRKLEMIY